MFLSSDSSLKHPLYPVQIEHHRWEAICQGAQSETITCRGCQAMGASRPLSILGSPLSRRLHIWNHGNACADTCPPFPPSMRESCSVAQASPSSVPSSIVVFDALQYLLGKTRPLGAYHGCNLTWSNTRNQHQAAIPWSG